MDSIGLLAVIAPNSFMCSCYALRWAQWETSTLLGVPGPFSPGMRGILWCTLVWQIEVSIAGFAKVNFVHSAMENGVIRRLGETYARLDGLFPPLRELSVVYLATPRIFAHAFSCEGSE